MISTVSLISSDYDFEKRKRKESGGDGGGSGGGWSGGEGYNEFGIYKKGKSNGKEEVI